jgi:DNA-binding FadR family transcriptional regulator
LKERSGIIYSSDKSYLSDECYLMTRSPFESDFIRYLANTCFQEGGEQLPSLQELSQELGISVSALREQLEVARALGMVEVRPRTGIRRQPYSFSPAVTMSLSYALQLSPKNFEAFADLRNRLEDSYYSAAVEKLTKADHHELQRLVKSAWDKLHGYPVQIPHEEHRRLHLLIYSRLENPFVTGLLEAFWGAYETVGLSMFTDYHYLQQVWNYHQQIVDAICSGNEEAGHLALIEHKDLLTHRQEKDQERS